MVETPPGSPQSLRGSSPVRGYHSTPSSSNGSEVGLTFEEYEREAENALKGIFTTAESIISGEAGSFGPDLDGVLLPVVEEIKAL